MPPVEGASVEARLLAAAGNVDLDASTVVGMVRCGAQDRRQRLISDNQRISGFRSRMRDPRRSTGAENREPEPRSVSGLDVRFCWACSTNRGPRPWSGAETGLNAHHCDGLLSKPEQADFVCRRLRGFLVCKCCCWRKCLHGTNSFCHL